jgi:hypothetical protein
MCPAATEFSSYGSMASCPRMYSQRGYKGNMLKLMSMLPESLIRDTAFFSTEVIKLLEVLGNKYTTQGQQRTRSIH